MTRPDGDLLVTPTEAAARLGWPLGTFRDRARQPGFPRPVKQGGRGQTTLYWWPDLTQLDQS